MPLSFTDSYLVEEVTRDGYRDQIVTRLHSVMWVYMHLCIHSSCTTVMPHAHIMYTSIRAVYTNVLFLYVPFIYIGGH